MTTGERFDLELLDEPDRGTTTGLRELDDDPRDDEVRGTTTGVRLEGTARFEPVTGARDFPEDLEDDGEDLVTGVRTELDVTGVRALPPDSDRPERDNGAVLEELDPEPAEGERLPSVGVERAPELLTEPRVVEVPTDDGAAVRPEDGEDDRVAGAERVDPGDPVIRPPDPDPVELAPPEG